MGEPGRIYWIWIPGVLPGLNALIAAAKVSRGKFNKYASLKKEWGAYCLNHIKAYAVPKWQLRDGSCQVNLKWVCRDKRRDPDNVAAGGGKIILDSLVHAGILPDDSFQFVSEINHLFVVNKTDPGVEIELVFSGGK